MYFWLVPILAPMAAKGSRPSAMSLDSCRGETPRYSYACCRGIWLGYFSRSISASLWFICGSSFPPAPCLKGTHVLLVLVEPDDCLQKGGAQELFLRTGNQAGGYFDCASHGSHLLMDCSHTQTDLINRRLVDSAVILPSPYSFVNKKYIKWRHIKQSSVISTNRLVKGDSICYDTNTDTKEGAERK